ncbi:MAG: RHS repeat-associated core domain-containing protein [Treponema sp.]|nr:RHS repeat-associated core domain-containing protein [Treponema sp.]
MWTLHTDSGNSVYGGQSAKNIYLGETRIVTKLNSGSNPTYQEEYYKQYYYHSDHLGSASLISDYKGDEYQRIEYTPYGETWVEKTSNTGLEFLPYKFTAKELDKETGLYYYGARYLDPRYSRWISTDPALGEYIPKAPTDEEAKRHNQNLPGMGGVFNTANASLYHYAGNNPVKYIDPDGREAGYVLDNEGACGMGHAGMYVKQEDGKYAFFEVTGIPSGNNISEDNTVDELSKSPNSFPSPGLSEKLNFPCNSGALLRIFDTKEEMEKKLAELGFDEAIEFNTTFAQDKLIYNAALSNGKNFIGYNLATNSCGIFARNALTTDGSGIKPFNVWLRAFGNQSTLKNVVQNAIPKSIAADLMLANKHARRKY